MLKSFFKFSLLFIPLFACNRDKTPPVIVITSPQDGASYVTEGVWKTQADISDNNILTKVTYTIYGNTKVFEPNQSSFRLDEWASMYNVGGNYVEIKVTAEDAEGNITNKTIRVKHSQ